MLAKLNLGHRVLAKKYLTNENGKHVGYIWNREIFFILKKKSDHPFSGIDMVFVLKLNGCLGWISINRNELEEI